ncbi:MAG: carbohydrate ABC transporter permease [Clostridia bacterium]|nr:carbohydrate ABC transporter permease [Clostridia bacterium]
MAMKKVLKVKPARSVLGSTGSFVVLLLCGVVMILPMLFIISNAFKPMDELFMYPPKLFVRNPTTDNFSLLATVFEDSQVPFFRYLFNTLSITVIATVGKVVVATMAGYVLEKKRFPGRKFIFNMVVTAMLFTSAVTAIPNYLILSKLGWIDSYLSIVVPTLGASMGVFLVKQFMGNISNSILEAARVDGASEHRIFWTLVVPNVKPAWLTLVIFTVQDTWGETGGTYIYSEELKTLQTALNQIVASGISRTGVSAAISLIMMIVPITVFILTQKNVVQTMMSSGIKE